MSLDEIRSAVLALGENEKEIILDSIIEDRQARELTSAQAADLARREADYEANPDETEDGETVMNRLFAEYAPGTPRVGPDGR